MCYHAEFGRSPLKGVGNGAGNNLKVEGHKMPAEKF